MSRSLIKPGELLQDTRADETFVVCGAKPIRGGRAISFRRPDMATAVAPSRFQPGAYHPAPARPARIAS